MPEISPAEQPLILVISSQDDTRQSLCTVLNGAHYQVVLADNTAQAIAASASHSPHAILLDTRSGTSVVGQLKSSHLTPPVVLALVDSASPEILDLVLEDGADDTIFIPIHNRTLLNRLQHLLAVRFNAFSVQPVSSSISHISEIFQTLFEQAPDAVVILNPVDRTIIACNRAACEMNGYTCDELLGQSIDLLNAGDAFLAAEQGTYLDRLRASGHLHYETLHRRKDGTVFPIEVSTSLITAGGREYILGIDRDISKRKKAESELKANEERYRLLTKYTTDMITRHAANAEIVFASPASETLLGYTPEEMMGHSAYYFVHPSDKPAIIERHLNLSPDVDRYTDTYRARRKDGSYTWLETTSRRIRNAETNNIDYVISVSRDISDRKAVEIAEREQHTLAEALGDAAALLKGSLKTDEALDGILEQAARVVPYDSASITLIEDDYVRVVRSRGFKERGVQDHVMSLRFSITERPDFYRALLDDKQPIILDDVSAVEEWVVTPGTKWIQSNLTVPVVVQDTAIALLHLDSARLSAFTPDQARRLKTFADQVAIAIQGAQLYDEVRALYHATSFLFASFDVDNVTELARKIAQTVVQEFHKVDCGILLVDSDGDKLPFLARAGNFLTHTDKVLHLDDPGLIAESVRTGQVIYAPDVRLDSRYFNVDDRTRSELVLPLRSQGVVIGALDLQSPEIDAFTPQDQRVLQAFAERSAIAIQNLQYGRDLEMRVVERTSELEQTKEQVEAILNNSSDAIIVTYIDGTIRRVNPAFNLLFGYLPGEGIEQPLSSLVASFDTGLLNSALEAAVMDSYASRIEIAVRRKDGSLFDADVVISPILERDEHSLGLVCSVRDMTERKRMETELRKALQQERELSELKSRFVSMASHEFRTPLAMIMTASELLQKYNHRMNEEQKSERLERIQTEVKNMARLIDDVLTVNKSVEDAALEFDPLPMNLVHFCNQLLQEMRLSTHDDHQFVFDVQGDYATLYLDQKFLRDILVNLLWNAVKYSPPQTEIKLILICGLEQTVIMIEDHGIGIPKDDQKRLFEAFHRGRNVGNVSGTGLGLAIARQAAELHGGTITFSSEVGVGSTFTVTIPTVLVEDGKYDHQDSGY